MKEPIGVFHFLHGNNHQGKVASKTTALDWVWPGMRWDQSDSRILWSSISLEGNNWYLCLTIVNLFYLLISRRDFFIYLFLPFIYAPPLFFLVPFLVRPPFLNIFSFLCSTAFLGCAVMWTVWNVSKYGVFSGLYFPVFGTNTGK